MARFRGEAAITTAHYCESEIEDRKVTRCGRQMRDIEGTEILAAPAGIDVCKRCYLP
jgi:hypothetical protein